MPQVALTTIFCVTALALGYVMAKVFGHDAGTAGGLMAGATAESATVGTATDAINRLPIDDAVKQHNHLAGLQNFVTTLFTIVAIAVSCLIGSWIYNAFWDPIFRSAGTMAEMMKSHLRWKR